MYVVLVVLVVWHFSQTILFCYNSVSTLYCYPTMFQSRFRFFQKKSEFREVFQRIQLRCNEELTADIQSLANSDASVGIEEHIAEIITLVLKTSAQITYDTIVNLDLLEED